MPLNKSKFSKKKIIKTAFEMVRSGGWNKLSVPVLARTINSSTMPIYFHFKNVRELQDAVYVKAIDFLFDYMTVDRPGDKWINHAVRFVEFACEEKHLFRCLFDGRNLELQRQELRRWNQQLLGHLTDYEAFKGLNDKQLEMVRFSRFMLVQGIATNMNMGWYPNASTDLEAFVSKTSMALFEGLKKQFEQEEE